MKLTIDNVRESIRRNLSLWPFLDTPRHEIETRMLMYRKFFFGVAMDFYDVEPTDEHSRPSSSMVYHIMTNSNHTKRVIQNAAVIETGEIVAHHVDRYGKFCDDRLHTLYSFIYHNRRKIVKDTSHNETRTIAYLLHMLPYNSAYMFSESNRKNLPRPIMLNGDGVYTIINNLLSDVANLPNVYRVDISTVVCDPVRVDMVKEVLMRSGEFELGTNRRESFYFLDNFSYICTDDGKIEKHGILSVNDYSSIEAELMSIIRAKKIRKIEGA